MGEQERHFLRTGGAFFIVGGVLTLIAVFLRPLASDLTGAESIMRNFAENVTRFHLHAVGGSVGLLAIARWSGGALPAAG